MMAIFGIFWSLAMVGPWTNVWTIVVAVVFIALAVMYYVAGVVVMRNLKRWRAAQVPPPDEAIAQSKRGLRSFSILFGIEGGLIAVSSVTCVAIGHWEYIVPLIVLIMGAHFIPFAPMYHRRFDYIPGVLGVCVGISGVVAVTQGVEPTLIVGVMGLGAAFCTTIYGLYDLRVIRRIRTFGAENTVKITGKDATEGEI